MKFKENELRIIFYSTFLIIIIETIFFLISPQLFTLIGFLPLLIIGFVVKLRLLFLNLILSNFLLVFANFGTSILSSKSIINVSFMLVFVFFSSLILLFFVFLKLSEEKQISFGSSLSNYNLVCNLLLLSFIFFFFSRLDLSEIQLRIIDSINTIFNDSNLNRNTQMEGLVKNVVSILPSINFLIILISLSLNCLISQIIIKKLNLPEEYQLNIHDSIVPKSFLSFFTLCFLSLVILPPSIHMYVNNVLILSSFCFLTDGLIFVTNYLKKFEINKYIKFIFIFLLFIFLGYVLFLLIFFLGYYRSCKKIFLK